MGYRKKNIGLIDQGNDASSITNKRGMARRAKRQSSKRRRQRLSNLRRLETAL